MTVLWLKFVHIAALALWVAGLIYLPSMLLGHRRVQDHQDFARVRMASRFIYIGIVSPAAFVAIGAGSALLFLTDALHPWMFVKLMAVGLLVLAHLQYGAVLAHLAEEEAKAPTLRVRLIGATTMTASLAIVTLVLAKPDIRTDVVPGWASEPGLLRGPESAPPARHPGPQPS